MGNEYKLTAIIFIDGLQLALNAANISSEGDNIALAIDPTIAVVKSRYICFFRYIFI
jgi:hypothetical protein